ncbi:hypothetical protein SUGI_1193290 [Cryptomeria japonica]|nr:hypothetical protein SUGI_1193290 [Cryptomeria japonica]
MDGHCYNEEFCNDKVESQKSVNSPPTPTESSSSNIFTPSFMDTTFHGIERHIHGIHDHLENIDVEIAAINDRDMQQVRDIQEMMHFLNFKVQPLDQFFKEIAHDEMQIQGEHCREIKEGFVHFLNQ